jgi:hypothetical protein
MVDTHPPFITDNPLVEPHQLCKCCQRLAMELIRVYPGRRHRNGDYICEHYGSLQNLIDGTRGGCHCCNLVSDCIKRECMRLDQSLPLWLQSRSPEAPFDDQASEIKTITSTSAQRGSNFHHFVLISFDDGQRYLPKLCIKFRNAFSATVTPYTETQLSTRVASDAHYQLIQEWLDTCTDSVQHPACNRTSTFQRPTRLLDLDYYFKNDTNVGRQDVRLVEGNSSTGQYAALSYCWGAVKQLKLLQMNLQQFQERITFDELS